MSRRWNTACWKTRAVIIPKCGRANSYLQWWPDIHHCIVRVCPYEYLFLYAQVRVVLALSSAAAAHCGRAFKMAFTSSATAVSANSNWSWSERTGEKERWRMEKWTVREGWKSTLKVLKQCKHTHRLMVPWCGPSRVSGLWCAPVRLRCRSPSLLTTR